MIQICLKVFYFLYLQLDEDAVMNEDDVESYFEEDAESQTVSNWTSHHIFK